MRMLTESTDPFLSIVIPTYNSEKHLPALMKSIEAQKFKDLELIFVDNLSSDGTKEIVDKYREIFDITFLSEKDKGQGDAVTKGLKLARGKIHHWHASDDIVMPDAFSVIFSIFEEMSDVDLVFSDGLAFDSALDRVYSSWPTNGLNKNLMKYNFGRFQSDTAYWRSSMTKSLLPLRDDIPLIVDEEFFLRAVIRARKIKRAMNPLGAFRIRAGQISQVSNRSDLEQQRQLIKNRILGEITFFEKFLGLLSSVLSRGLILLGRSKRRVIRLFGGDVYSAYKNYIQNLERL